MRMEMQPSWICHLCAEPSTRLFAHKVLGGKLTLLGLTVCNIIQKCVFTTWHIVDYPLSIHFYFCDSGIVNWNSVPEDIRRKYRVEYKLSDCSQCNVCYKDNVGYFGNGKKGVCQAFYADQEFPGFCSMDCYYQSGRF